MNHLHTFVLSKFLYVLYAVSITQPSPELEHWEQARLDLIRILSFERRWMNTPGSPLKPGGGSLEHKAKLIALSVGDDHVVQLLHHRPGALRHQPQRSFIIGFGKVVFF